MIARSIWPSFLTLVKVKGKETGEVPAFDLCFEGASDWSIKIYRKNLYYLCIECWLFCVLCFHHLTTCIVFDFLIYADWGSQIQYSTWCENWFEHIFSEVFHQAQWLNDDASPKHNKWPATFKSRVPLSIATPYSKWESNHIVKKYLKDDQFFPLPLPALACVFRSRICECVNQIWSWLQKQEHTPMFPDAPLQHSVFQPANESLSWIPLSAKKIINVIAPSTHAYNSPIPPSIIATS